MSNVTASSNVCRLGIARTTLLVGLIFLIHSFVSVPVPGVNEPHYLTKARSFCDPYWCSGDLFLQSADAHAVFFAVVGPLTTILPFAIVAIGGRVISHLLLALGWCLLGRRLCLKDDAVVVSAASFCLIAVSGNFSGEWIVGGFESKVPAYGFALVAVSTWLTAWRSLNPRDYVLAGVSAGFAVAVHPIVGLWFCIGIALAELCLRRTSRGNPVRQPTVGSFVGFGLLFSTSALVFSLPGLIPAARLVLSADVTEEVQNQANYIQVYWRLGHHLDPGKFSTWSWIHTAVLSGLCTCLVLGLFRKTDNSQTEQPLSAPIECFECWQPFMMLLLMSALISVCGIVVGWHSVPFTEIPDWEWRAKLLRYYPFRFFDGLLPIVTSIALAAVTHRFAGFKESSGKIMVLLVAAVCLCSAIARPWAPSGYASTSFELWKEACRWLDDNTSPDCLVYGPREGFGLKWYSNRAEYVCFKDCPQDAPGIVEWNRRLNVMHKWSEASFKDQMFHDEDLVRLHALTGITHILTNRLGPFETGPVYRNNGWKIYELPVADSQ